MSQNSAPLQLQKINHGESDNYTEVERFQMVYDRDNVELTRLGKRPVLKRNFGLMTMFGFNCAVMQTWEIMLCQFGGNFTNGGYAGAVYGFMFCWIGTLCAFTSMAELASMAPTSGGQYHWVSILAPTSCQKFFSYIVGWFNTLGWQAISTIGGFLASSLIEGLIVLNNPDFEPTRWQSTLLLWATIVFAVFINTALGRFLPKIEGLILIFHVIAFFALLVPLVYLSPHNDAKTVFTTFVNDGGWPTTGLSFMVGLLVPANVLLGGDAAVHMSEEIRNASTNVPRVMVGSLIANGILALLTLFAILFCIQDLKYVFDFSSLPFVAVLLQGIGNRAGTTAMVAIITFLIIFASVSFVATASRMTCAFARDRGLPGWEYLSKVKKSTAIPMISVGVTMIISCLLGLINLGLEVAFEDVLSLIIGGLFTSYLIGNCVLLWHRLRGTISPYEDAQGGPTNIVQAGKLTWGPWRVPEPFGTIVNVVGIIYLIIVLFFSYWPTEVSPSAANMNWSVLVVGVVGIFSILYYLVWARRVYVGPVIEVDFG